MLLRQQSKGNLRKRIVKENRCATPTFTTSTHTDTRFTYCIRLTHSRSPHNAMHSPTVNALNLRRSNLASKLPLQKIYFLFCVIHRKIYLGPILMLRLFHKEVSVLDSIYKGWFSQGAVIGLCTSRKVAMASMAGRLRSL